MTSEQSLFVCTRPAGSLAVCPFMLHDLGIVCVTICVVELLIMVGLDMFPTLSPAVAALSDPVLLLLISFPIITCYLNRTARTAPDEECNYRQHLDRSPYFILLILGLSIFAAELVIMVVFGALPPLPKPLETILDPILLMLVIYPVLYRFLLKPLLLQIRRRQETETFLSRTRQKLSTLIDSIDGIFWEADPETMCFSYVSPQVARITGYAPEAWTGTERFWEKCIHPDDRELVVADRRDAAGNLHDHQLVYRLLTANRSTVWVRDMVSVTVGDDGGVGLCGIMVDITAVKEAEARVCSLNEDLEQRIAARTDELAASNRELELFCHSISHDLRAPLRGICGYSDALLEEFSSELGETGQGYLMRVDLMARRMTAQIDELLKLSSMSRGELKHEPVSLSDMAEDILAEYRRLEPDRHVTISVAPGISTIGDPILLYAMLENLLSNAWKFTCNRPEARIEFGVTDDACQRVCYVRDNGAGFNPVYAENLFTPFHRMHRQDEFPGTGIGLATVQRVVKRHGGEVWAEAAPDKGATFFFTIGHRRPDIRIA